jgi:hypothetical protein
VPDFIQGRIAQIWEVTRILTLGTELSKYRLLETEFDRDD